MYEWKENDGITYPVVKKKKKTKTKEKVIWRFVILGCHCNTNQLKVTHSRQNYETIEAMLYLILQYLICENAKVPDKLATTESIFKVLLPI